MMTLLANYLEDCVHFSDFISLILANVGASLKLWQSRRNTMAPLHLICLALNFSSLLNKSSWLKNGLQFASDVFADFVRMWDFKHLTSSPGNSKANGKDNSGVKTAKRILKKSIRAGTNPYLTILALQGK